MSNEKISHGILATPEDSLIMQLNGYVYGGLSIQMTTLVGILQLLERQRDEIAELRIKNDALKLSQIKIINDFSSLAKETLS